MSIVLASGPTGPLVSNINKGGIMAKVIRVDGRTFVQPNWHDDDRDSFTMLNDNRRERADTNKMKLVTMYLFDR